MGKKKTKNTFQYFLPNVSESAAKKAAIARGLEYALGDDGTGDDVYVSECPKGPDGLKGAMLRRHRGVQYSPDKQTWMKNPNEDWYVGWDTDNPPGPEDVERSESRQFGSYAVPLGDGRRWTVPTAGGYEEDACPLPHVRMIDAKTGKLVKRPRAEFDRLRCYASEIRDHMMGLIELERSADGLVDFEREVDICMEALRVNYRIGIMEASVLELLDEDAVRMIFYALVNRLSWPDAVDKMSKMGGEE